MATAVAELRAAWEWNHKRCRLGVARGAQTAVELVHPADLALPIDAASAKQSPKLAMVANQRVDNLRGVEHQLAQVALGAQGAGVNLGAERCREAVVYSNATQAEHQAAAKHQPLTMEQTNALHDYTHCSITG